MTDAKKLFLYDLIIYHIVFILMVVMPILYISLYSIELGKVLGVIAFISYFHFLLVQKRELKTYIAENCEPIEIGSFKETLHNFTEKTQDASKINLWLVDQDDINAMAISSLFTNIADIIVFNGLGKVLDEEKANAVIGHEYGHILLRHLGLKKAISSGGFFVSFLSNLLLKLVIKLFGFLMALTMGQNPIVMVGGLILLLAVAIPLSGLLLLIVICEIVYNAILKFIIQQVSQNNEYEADLVGALLVSKQNMIEALEIIESYHSTSMPEYNPSNEYWLVYLFKTKIPYTISTFISSHPTHEKRVNRLNSEFLDEL